MKPVQNKILAVPFVFPHRNEESLKKIQGWLDGNVYRRAPTDLNKIVRYLTKGHIVVASPSIAFDPFEGSFIDFPYQSAFVTDGRWVWNMTIAYWVEHYHLKLSAKFLSDIRKRKFKMKRRSLLDCQEISMCFQELLETGSFDFSAIE